MEMQATGQPSAYEQTVLTIMRRLPPERVLQLVDFARFLEFQMTERYDYRSGQEEPETEEEIRASEEKWNAPFAKPEAKRAMREMAREAREVYHAEQTTVETHAVIWVSEEEIGQDLPTYLRRVEAGEAFLIMKAGKPMAEIKPVASVSEPLRPFGLCAGEFTVPSDFDDPLPEHILQEFEG
jgi:antitoxin (DNA-binding transcriptional repressor) of toxin-antitoxin stability system